LTWSLLKLKTNRRGRLKNRFACNQEALSSIYFTPRNSFKLSLSHWLDLLLVTVASCALLTLLIRGLTKFGQEFLFSSIQSVGHGTLEQCACYMWRWGRSPSLPNHPILCRFEKKKNRPLISDLYSAPPQRTFSPVQNNLGAKASKILVRRIFVYE
jgi:hypothetical protein